LAEPAAPVVYLEAHYPHTSLGFLIPSLLLFAALTIALRAIWPIALIFALVTVYLARFTLRQARGPNVAIRITDRAIYHRPWVGNTLRRGLPGGEIPLEAIGGIEIVHMRTRASTTAVIAIWLNDPGRYRIGRGLFDRVRQMTGAGDLMIDCDEADQNAAQVKEALDAALADHLARAAS